MDTSRKIQEITVPVPWGHIAVKAWGDEQNTAILVVHGRMDNAGAFDRLIPLLPPSFYYLCMDLPGHGKSSHFPPFLPLYTVNNVLAYKLVMQYFRRSSYTIIGHSYGGQIAFLVAQLYPKYVDKLVMLDTVHTLPQPSSHFRNYLAEKLDANLELQVKLATKSQPTYTYEEAFKKLMSGRQGTAPLLPEAAEGLIKRALEPAGDDKFMFTMDQRMKCYIDPLHDLRYALETIRHDPVNSPILIILANQSKLVKLYFKDILHHMRRKMKNIILKSVEGDHDVHNNNPEIVAPLINKFLLRQKGKL